MALNRRTTIWIGAVATISVAGFFWMRATFEPSQTETRAFLQRLLVENRRIHARGADGVVIALDTARVARVASGACRPDPDERRYGRQYVNVGRNFVCLYTVVTRDNTRFTTALRATREPAGGPADTPSANPLVNPARSRVGSFRLSAIGLKEAEKLLDVPG